MSEKNSHNKFSKNSLLVLVVGIVIFIGLCGCTTIPPGAPSETTLLTIQVGSQMYNYSLDDLTALNSVSGQGGYINQKGKITGPYNYTGVSVLSLLGSIPSLPNNYTILATANDGYNVSYSMDEVYGKIPILNETGVEIQIGNFTMIVAYKENGVFLNETTKGPLRIAFIDDEPAITNSGLWVSSLVKIEIIEK